MHELDKADAQGLLSGKVFEIRIQVGQPIVVGQDEVVGRRQLIPILSGTVEGPGLRGEVLPGGVDSQIIRPDGRCELSARYALRLDDGAGIYVENKGIRTVPAPYVADVKAGRFVDPNVYYFRTTPTFETYSEKYSWLMNAIFVCKAMRYPEAVVIEFYRID
jgi:hypothetical protein